jgi:hypothetical protein
MAARFSLFCHCCRGGMELPRAPYRLDASSDKVGVLPWTPVAPLSGELSRRIPLMRGNPNLRAESVHPFHHSGAIIDDPRPERVKSNQQQVRTDDDESRPGPPPGALLQTLAAELADFLWKRKEPGLDQLPPSTGDRSSAHDPGIWRDELLAEIEDLAETLKEKVDRYSLLLEGQSSERANQSAVLWIQDALEDVAATALGIEIASRELFLRAASAGEQDSKSETAQEQTAGTPE